MFISFILIGLLIATPIIYLGMYYQISTIKDLGTAIFFLCVLCAAISWAVYISGMLSGKYRNIQDKE